MSIRKKSLVNTTGSNSYICTNCFGEKSLQLSCEPFEFILCWIYPKTEEKPFFAFITNEGHLDDILFKFSTKPVPQPFKPDKHYIYGSNGEKEKELESWYDLVDIAFVETPNCTIDKYNDIWIPARIASQLLLELQEIGYHYTIELKAYIFDLAGKIITEYEIKSERQI